MLQALNQMKTGKAPGPSEVSLELIAASGGVGIQVMAEICQKVQDGYGMPAEWSLSIVVPIFKGKGDIWKCNCYRAVKLLEHGMKAVEMVLEKKLCRIVYVDEILFGFMSERGTVDAVFILRRLQEEYNVTGKKLCMCSMHLKKAFDRVPQKALELAMMKKALPEAMDRSVRGLSEGAKTRLRVDYLLTEEYKVKVGMHQGSVLSHFLSTVVVDVVTEFAREGMLSELLYTDDSVLVSETIKGLRNKF